jgi:hypothetical protein
VMTGHPAMVWDAFSRDTVRKYWLLHDLMRGLALRRMETFAFAGNNLHRQEIGWDKGGRVWVNRSAEDWTTAEHTLPQYGFYARVPAAGVEAAIECHDGSIVEWAKSPAILYVNARPVVPEPPAGRGGRRPEEGPDPRLPRMNPTGRVIPFGAVSTNGGFRLARTGEYLELTPLPNSPPFTVSIRWRELPWSIREPKQAEAIDESGNELRQVRLDSSAGEVRFATEQDAFAYRIR